ncbi:MAG: TetR/AcrR family transcriptional regulator [Chloroflexi bacterium]|nr:MAG: TetR/AcrR family transcriptional regulator [Chloroflexota bacterium]
MRHGFRDLDREDARLRRSQAGLKTRFGILGAQHAAETVGEGFGDGPHARVIIGHLGHPLLHASSEHSLCWYIRMTGVTATESTRDQIIHAAADSLLENGYSGTSVRAIASKAGVAIGNLQYWFPTKSELLVEAWRYLTVKSVEELRRTLNQLTDPLVVLEIGVESLWDSLRRLGDVQLAAFDLLVQAPRTERLRAYLPELFTRYREVIQEQLDRLEVDGRIRLTVPRDVLVPLVLNTVLGFGLYYVVTRDDESCVRALSAFRQLAGSLIEPVN